MSGCKIATRPPNGPSHRRRGDGTDERTFEHLWVVNPDFGQPLHITNEIIRHKRRHETVSVTRWETSRSIYLPNDHMHCKPTESFPLYQQAIEFLVIFSPLAQGPGA